MCLHVCTCVCLYVCVCVMCVCARGYVFACGYVYVYDLATNIHTMCSTHVTTYTYICSGTLRAYDIHIRTYTRVYTYIYARIHLATYSHERTTAHTHTFFVLLALPVCTQ